MERVKTNKYAMILFIISLIILALGVIDIIVTFATMGASTEVVRQMLEKQGTDAATIDKLVQIIIVVAYVSILVGAVLLIFEVLCGLKCSMYGRWRVGAIVFGVLLIASYIANAILISSLWFSWINAVVGILYLISAIMCKPDKPASLA